MRDQEQADRELFMTNRGAFNAKQRKDYEHQEKARQYAKEARDAKMGRSERRERAGEMDTAARKAAETMEEVKEFNEARAQEKEPPNADGSK